MLHVTKLAPGQQRYYLHTAAGRDEGGEGPGRWLGRGAAALGLTGEVARPDLEELLTPGPAHTAGRITPATRRRRRNPGFDLTFGAPKSVSVVGGLGSPEVARTVEAAHADAVAAAVGYLERDAARAIRGGRPVPVGGVVAAAFAHSASRLGDPHLHTHVLVANLVEASDGRWSALDARGLYLHASVAGALYQAHLRYCLSQQLGLRFADVRHGVAQVVGVSAEVQRAFSRRRTEVEAALVARGAWSPRAARVAALATRPPRAPGPVERRAEWRARAARLGLGDERRAALGRPGRASQGGRDDVEAGTRRVLGAAGVTRDASTFSRRDVLWAWCNQLPHGASVEAVEHLATATLARPEVNVVSGAKPRSGDVLRLGSGRVVPGVVDEVRWTTHEMQVIEAGLTESARARATGTWPRASARAVQSVLAARAELPAAVASAASRVASSPGGVTLVSVASGADRLAVLDAACAAWTAGGLVVRAAGHDVRALAELEAHTGVPAQDGWQVADRSVLIVHGADTLGSRQLARWFDVTARSHATLVLVATPEGLRPTDGRGGWRALEHALGAVALELPRQSPSGPALARGDAALWREWSGPDGRVVLAATPAEVRERLVADWWSGRQAGQPVAMVTGRRQQAELLNGLARQRLAASGGLEGRPWRAADREWQAGDEVLARRNDRLRGVEAGAVYTVRHAGPAGLELDGGGRLPAGYVEAGHAVHAYARTVYDAHHLDAGTRLLVWGPDRLLALSGGTGLLAHGAMIDRYLVEARTPEPEHDPLGRLVAEWRAIGAAPAVGASPAVGVASAAIGASPPVAAAAAVGAAPVAIGAARDLDVPTLSDPAAARDRLAAGLRATMPPDVSEALRQARAARDHARDALAGAGPARRSHWERRLAATEGRVSGLEGQAEQRRQWIVDHGGDIEAYARAREAAARHRADLARVASARGIDGPARNGGRESPERGLGTRELPARELSARRLPAREPPFGLGRSILP